MRYCCGFFDGSCVGVHGVSYLSENVVLESALLHLEIKAEKYESLFDHLPLGFSDWGKSCPDMCLGLCSATVETISGRFDNAEMYLALLMIFI